MAINPNYKPPKTGAGKLRIPITFYLYGPDDGPEPGEGRRTVLHKCMCEAYNPSIKDLTIMGIKGTKEAVTVKIRDPGKEYLPTNKQFAQLDDYRFPGKELAVIDVRPDMEDGRFITILLEVTS